MALPSSGEIKFSQIATEFGDTTPFTMSSWYKGGYYVSNIPAQNASIPSAGRINLNVFHGAQRPSGTASWTTAQTTTWTVPSGIFSVMVNACGGGGGGGQADGGTNFQGYGGAGGGANLKGNVSYAVTPGLVLNITVGAGGPLNGGQGTYGGQSTVTASGVMDYAANGGMGGQNYVSGSGISAWAGAGAYGANYATATTSRTFTPGASFNGGSAGGRGGNAGNYTPGLAGEAGKVYIYY